MSLNLTGNFELERNDNHIIFEYTPDYFVSSERYLDYCGGELSFLGFESVEVGSKEYKKILAYLKKHYGFPPFDSDEVAENLKVYNHIDY